ncbi:16S rRNA (guanine(527)-N(7))-methyltransferase RsmG [bacterium]|nr:16S rRNA (guanine(527)-N(7))-methyltransferase RsmG [bacterium]
MDHKEELKAILDGLNAPADALEKFQNYHAQLLAWNGRVNLISKNDESRIGLRHFIDSLALLSAVPFPAGLRVLDLGTGAGFPGVPIKIIRPDIDLVLVESNRRKGLFLRRLVQNLDMTGIDIFVGRAEDLVNYINPVGWICSRAVAKIQILLQWSIPYLTPGTATVVALKGPDASTELKILPKRIKGRSIIQARWIAFKPFPDVFPDLERYVVYVVLNNKTA